MSTGSPAKEHLEIVRNHARMFDVPTQAVIATTANGEIVYWSVAASILYGWKEPEAMGRNIVDVTPALQNREQAEQIMRALRSGNIWTGEFGVRARDGKEFRVHVRDVPVRSSGGELIGIIGVSNPA